MRWMFFLELNLQCGDNQLAQSQIVYGYESIQ